MTIIEISMIITSITSTNLETAALFAMNLHQGLQ